MTYALTQLFIRDIDRLQKEIDLYETEKDLWEIDGDIKNSAGNLCLHIIGNLSHFIGAVLGKTGYVRKRENEFAAKNIDRSLLKSELMDVSKLIEKVLLNLSEDDLKRTYPINVFQYEMSTSYFLIHLNGHLNYHLGQINYHRRMLNTTN